LNSQNASPRIKHTSVERLEGSGGTHYSDSGTSNMLSFNSCGGTCWCSEWDPEKTGLSSSILYSNPKGGILDTLAIVRVVTTQIPWRKASQRSQNHGCAIRFKKLIAGSCSQTHRRRQNPETSKGVTPQVNKIRTTEIKPRLKCVHYTKLKLDILDEIRIITVTNDIANGVEGRFNPIWKWS